MLRENGMAEEHAENGKAGSGHNWLTMLFCVFAAICIWFYVMRVDSPTSTETYSSVPVKIVNVRNTENGNNLTAISGQNNVIEVTLKGKKSVLNDVSSDTIEAYVNVSDVTVSGKGTYEVVVEAPAGTVIEEYFPSEITVYMDKKNIVTIPVRCKLVDYIVGSEYTLDISNPVLSIETVRVSGPESELEDIDYARMTLSPGTITQSFSGAASFELIDKNGNVMNSKYLSLSDKEGKASYNVYTTKYLPLTMDYKYGWFSENGTVVSVSPSRVKVRGLVEKLNQLSGLTVATMDETKVTDSGEYNYNLPLPDGVELAEGQKVESVTATVKFHNTAVGTVNFPRSKIELKNIPGDKQVQILDDSLQVRLRGVGVSTLYLSSNDVTVSVDLTGVGSGEQSVTAEVAVKDGNSATLYAVGEYAVHIKVTDKE